MDLNSCAERTLMAIYYQLSTIRLFTAIYYPLVYRLDKDGKPVYTEYIKGGATGQTVSPQGLFAKK